MKKAIKILSAVVIAAFTMACVCFGISTISKKDSVYADTTEITITGFNTNNANIAVFNISGGDATSARNTSVEAYVNDVKTSLTVFGDEGHTNATKLTFFINTLNASSYQHIRIPAGTKIGDCTLATEYNFYNLLNANDGGFVWVGQESTTEITITGINAIALGHAGLRSYVALGVAEGATINTGAMYNCGIVYATEDGNIFSDYTLYGGASNVINVNTESNTSVGLMLDYTVFGTPATAPRLFKIPAGTVWGGYLGEYRITNTFYLLYNGTTFQYYDYNPTEENLLEVVEFARQDTSSRYVVRMSGSGNGTYNAIGSVTVKVDGETQTASYLNWENDVAFLIPYDIFPATGYHTLEIDKQLLSDSRVFKGGYSVKVYNGAVVNTINVNNATVKMGDGDKFTNAFYAFDGSWTDGGWFVNNTETTGDVNIKFNIESETRTAAGLFGATRLISADPSAQWAVTHGIIDYYANDGDTIWTTYTNSNDITLTYNATTHRRLANGLKWGWAHTESASGISYTDAGGDAGVTTAYEVTDSMGAKWFGVAWGGGKYALKATMQIYDADYNDLGIKWSTPSATVSSELVGIDGGKIYFVSPYEYTSSVSVTTKSGTNVTVVNEGNGSFSFTMPNEEVTISTTEKTTSDTLSYNGFVNQTDSNRYVLILNGGSGDGTYGKRGDVTINVDGAEQTAEYWGWGDNVAFVIPYSILPNEDFHEVEIGEQTLADGNTFAGDCHFYVESGVEILPISKRTGAAYQYNETEGTNRYVVFFRGLTADEYVYHIGNVTVNYVNVNDGSTGTKSIEFYRWYGDQTAMLFNASDFPITNKYKITVPKGKAADRADGVNVDKNVYYFTNTITFILENQTVEDDLTKVTWTANGETKTESIVWSEATFNGLFSATTIEGTGLKVLGYTYNNTLYKSLVAVYESINSIPETVEFNVETITLENVAGASIRTSSDYQGLRFSTKISEERPASITEYGMYFTSADIYDSLGKKFTAITDGTDGYKISSTDADFKKWVKGDGYEYYNFVLKVNAANYNLRFTACAYVVVSYPDGTSETLLASYSVTNNVRSAYEVASAAIDYITDTATDTYVYTQKYVDGVVDIDYNYNLIGKDRSYTVTKTADGKITLTAKDGTGFDVASVLAFSVNGSRKSATFSGGVVTFDSNMMTAESQIKTAIEGAGRSGRSLEIMAYYGPSIGIHLSEGVLTSNTYTSSTVEDVKKYFDAGFNYFVAEEADYGAYRAEGINYGSTTTGTKNDAFRTLDLVALYCDQYGITDANDAPVIVRWSVIEGVMDVKDRNSSLSHLTDDALKKHIKEEYDKLKAYTPSYPDGYTSKKNGTPLNCFKGFLLRDEPYGEDLDLYLQWYNYLAVDLGMLADGYQLVGAVLSYGTQEKFIVSGSESTNTTSDATYETNYLDKIVNSINSNSVANDKQYLMTDAYPFYTKYYTNGWSSSKNVTHYISSTNYFMSLENYAQRAKDNGMLAGFALQSFTCYNQAAFNAVANCGYFSSASCTVTGTIDSSGNVIANEGQISYQAYMALCYGYKRIDYFTYWEMYNSTAVEKVQQAAVMWAYDSSTGNYIASYQPTYDWIKNTNNEIKNFEDVILAFDWQGTRLVKGSSATQNCYGNAASYTSDNMANTATGTYDLAVGCFDLDGTKGYMFVNADNPINNRSNTVSVTFEGYTNAVCYIDGVATVKSLTNGTLNLSVGAGEGVFVVPMN